MVPLDRVPLFTARPLLSGAGSVLLQLIFDFRSRLVEIG